MHIEPFGPAGSRSRSTSADVRDEMYERAEDALRALRELTSCDACEVCVWDPFSETHRHYKLTADGYSETVSDTSDQFLRPVDFDEGTSRILRLRDGRDAGELHVSWSSPEEATAEHMAVIESFQRILAGICDLLRSAQIVAENLAPGAHALVVSPTGVASDVPGRPTGRDLGEGGALRGLLLRMQTLRPGRFVWRDDEGACHSVLVLPCRGEIALVTEEAVPWPYGLTYREIEILHLIALGLSNRDIGRQLVVSPRTVSTHVEHILGKLRCTSRSQVAALAVREGLLLAEDPQVESTPAARASAVAGA